MKKENLEIGKTYQLFTLRYLISNYPEYVGNHGYTFYGMNCNLLIKPTGRIAKVVKNDINGVAVEIYNTVEDPIFTKHQTFLYVIDPAFIQKEDK